MKPALLLYPHISSYPVLMLLGFLFGWLLTRSRARFYRVDPKHLDNVALLLPIFGLVGARFFARLFYAKLPFLESLQIWKGDGLVFYGGFLFGIAAVLAYAAFRRLNLIGLCDCLAPGLALGLAFGRVGCFLGGCCWGDLCVNDAALAKIEPVTIHQVRTLPRFSSSEWPLALRFPPNSDPFRQHLKLGLVPSPSGSSLPVHPVQLYEAAFAALLAVWLHCRYRGKGRPGDASLALLLGYAMIRFLTEYLRADNKVYAYSLTISQLISIEIFLFGLATILLRFALARRRPHEIGPDLPQPLANETTKAECPTPN
jgi:phosphatidylglycerol---prolipoprotein diacylglyceryl transferase